MRAIFVVILLTLTLSFYHTKVMAITDYEKVEIVKELVNSKELQNWDWENAIKKIGDVVLGKKQNKQEAQNQVQYHKIGFARYLFMTIMLLIFVLIILWLGFSLKRR